MHTNTGSLHICGMKEARERKSVYARRCIYTQFWEIKCNLCVGIIKEKFAEWEPHWQSGPWTAERLFSSDHFIRGCSLNILPDTLWGSNDWRRRELTWAWAPILKVNPGSPTSFRLKPLNSLNCFSFVMAKTISLFQGCLKGINVYGILGRSLGHMVETQWEWSVL